MYHGLLHPRFDGPARAGFSLSALEGRFEIRLSRQASDIEAAQRLRFAVFHQELGAALSGEALRLGREADRYDLACDHLLVLDHARPAGDRAIGTYRLLQQAAARQCGGFCSAAEFDLDPLLARFGAGGGLLELGRACVHRDYRNSVTIRLLWRGIARYIADHAITHLFGCASFPGTDPERHATALAYLRRHCLMSSDIRVRAWPPRYRAMGWPGEGECDARAVFRLLPPLIKAYLRLGCAVGDGAVVDPEFATTDIFILLPVDGIDPRHLQAHLRDQAEPAG